MSLTFHAEFAMPCEFYAYVVRNALLLPNKEENGTYWSCDVLLNTALPKVYVTITANDARALRNTVNGALEQIRLIVRTIKTFGDQH